MTYEEFEKTDDKHTLFVLDYIIELQMHETRGNLREALFFALREVENVKYQTLIMMLKNRLGGLQK